MKEQDMCDSIELSFSVGHIDTTNHPKCWPLVINSKATHDGELLNRHTSRVTAKSPLTKAKYEIRPEVTAMEGGNYAVRGYTVSVNMPAGTVSTNALLDILVFLAALCARRMLQCYLLDNHCPWEVVKQVSLNEAALTSVDLTSLMLGSEKVSAEVMKKDLEKRASTLLLSSRMRRENSLSKVTSFTEDNTYTVYVHHSRGVRLKAYVKDRPTAKSFCDLPKDVEKAVFLESAKYLRIEAKLGPAWFRQHPEFSSLQSWKNPKKARAMHKAVFCELRNMLGLDMEFRKRAPKPKYEEKLTPAQKEVLTAYLKGEDILEHEALKGMTKQYVSKVKKAIWEKLHIDVDIPWKEHARIPKLEWFEYPGRYVLPKHLAHLAEYAFVRETVNEKLVLLREEVRRRRMQSETVPVLETVNPQPTVNAVAPLTVKASPRTPGVKASAPVVKVAAEWVARMKHKHNIGAGLKK